MSKKIRTRSSSPKRPDVAEDDLVRKQLAGLCVVVIETLAKCQPYVVVDKLSVGTTVSYTYRPVDREAILVKCQSLLNWTKSNGMTILIQGWNWPLLDELWSMGIPPAEIKRKLEELQVEAGKFETQCLEAGNAYWPNAELARLIGKSSTMHNKGCQGEHPIFGLPDVLSLMPSTGAGSEYESPCYEFANCFLRIPSALQYLSVEPSLMFGFFNDWVWINKGSPHEYAGYHILPDCSSDKSESPFTAIVFTKPAMLMIQYYSLSASTLLTATLIGRVQWTKASKVQRLKSIILFNLYGVRSDEAQEKQCAHDVGIVLAKLNKEKAAICLQGTLKPMFSKLLAL